MSEIPKNSVPQASEIVSPDPSSEATPEQKLEQKTYQFYLAAMQAQRLSGRIQKIEQMKSGTPPTIWDKWAHIAKQQLEIGGEVRRVEDAVIEEVMFGIYTLDGITPEGDVNISYVDHDRTVVRGVTSPLRGKEHGRGHSAMEKRK